MIIYRFEILLAGLLLMFLSSCTSVSSQAPPAKPIDQEAFNQYWYEGKAELNRYELKQARYGEIHEGDAVLIFVTEDFLMDKQVKYEYGQRSAEVKPILKLNFTRKFFTGVYPYSMMTSIFTPVDLSLVSPKVTTTSQEWCGHTYSQLNLKKDKYEGVLHSYFQSEGDQEFSLDAVLLEDEIWTKIRLNPTSLPTGKIELIPSTQYLRLKHQDFGVETAVATLEATTNPELSELPLQTYKIAYRDFGRVLTVTFESAFPHAIVAWSEEERGLKTEAVRTHAIKSAYWGKHDVKDAPLREQLGLNPANY